MNCLRQVINKSSAETPYGVPYRPAIWGAGWDIQSFAFRHYFVNKAFPELTNKEVIWNALNFVLGCHPGSNQASFASGVGSQSATTAYGLNRADWSYIPGVVSGTALIRPDFPELLEFPFPLATDRILPRRSLLTLYVHSIGSPASMEIR